MTQLQYKGQYPTFAVVDIETTGGNYYQDRIIEIAINVFDGNKVIAEYQTLINPERPILPFITKLTGISNSMVKKAPKFDEVAKEIHQVLDGHIFVAHNVRFDYNFVKASFKSIGVRYSSPHLCTVELSRKVFPNLPSYSLGKLCKSLGVELKDRHRAFGDTEATTILFGKIWSHQPGFVLQEIKSDEISPEFLPVGFDLEKLYETPESKGVFLFKDAQGEVVYVSKAKNLRNGILNFFKVPYETQTHPIPLKAYSFEYVEMPTDLSAQILETQYILQHRPVCNKFIRTHNYKFGLYVREDENGFEEFFISDISKQVTPPLQKFNSSNKGVKYVQNLFQRLQLNPTHKKVFNVQKYNSLLRSSLKYVAYPYPNCWVVEVNPYVEQSVVYVIKGYQFVGYGIVKDVKHTDFDEMESVFQPVQETTEIRRSLMQLIFQKKSHLQIIDLGDL